MKKFLLASFFALLFVKNVDAQSSSVTLQVTDAGGQSWNNGTWSVLLVSQPGATTFGPPFNLTTGGSVPNQSQSGVLNGTGGASMTLTQTSFITPTQSRWQFNVCPASGIPAQCFVQAVAIVGASPTITIVPPAISVTCAFGVSAYVDSEVACGVGGQYYSLTLNAQRQCTAVTGNVCTTWTAAGGGVTSVTSLPGTCTPGTLVSVVYVNGLAQGPFYCGGIGAAANTFQPDDKTQAVSPLSYGAKWDVKAVTDCPFTNGSNIVTCPSGETQFTSADLGKIVSGRTSPAALTTGCNGAGCGSEVIPQGFICTINSANSISIGTTYPGCAADNATAVCVPSTTVLCSVIWGTQDDSAAIQSAAVAAWTGNSCKTVEFPSGMAFFTVPAGGLLKVTLPNGSPCAGTAIADSTQGGAQVAGQGGSNSVLIPLSTVNFANCTGGQSGVACIAGPQNWFAHDWGVWGFGLADNGTTHTVNLIEFFGANPSCTGAAAWNMNLAAWETASAGSQGFVLGSGCGTLYASNVVSEGFGNSNCVLNNSSTPVFPTTVTALDCFGSSGATAGASLIVSGGTVNSTGSSY